MAINKVFAEDTRVNFAYTVPKGTESGDAVLVGADEDIPGVAITSRGDAEDTVEWTGLGITVTYPSGGQSLAMDQATVATTGTWDLAVDGADDATGQGVPVYIADGKLSLTNSGTDIQFGITNYPAEGYARTDGVAPVRIGAPN